MTRPPSSRAGTPPNRPRLPARGRHRPKQRRAAGRSGSARRRRAAGGADRPQRARAAHRVVTVRKALDRRAENGLLDSERIEQLAVAGGGAAARRARRPARPVLPDARGVGARVAVPGVSPLRARPRPCVVPAVVATRRGRRAPGVAVAGVGAPAPGRRDRPVGLVSRPRRPSHDDPARRRRPVQRLRRPPLRPSRRRAAARPATRGHVRTRRDPSTPATAGGRASAPAAARNAGRPREHTIRHSR